MYVPLVVTLRGWQTTETGCDPPHRVTRPSGGRCVLTSGSHSSPHVMLTLQGSVSPSSCGGCVTAPSQTSIITAEGATNIRRASGKRVLLPAESVGTDPHSCRLFSGDQDGQLLVLCRTLCISCSDVQGYTRKKNQSSSAPHLFAFFSLRHGGGCPETTEQTKAEGKKGVLFYLPTIPAHFVRARHVCPVCFES